LEVGFPPAIGWSQLGGQNSAVGNPLLSLGLLWWKIRVSRSGEEYAAQARGPNRKFRL